MAAAMQVTLSTPALGESDCTELRNADNELQQAKAVENCAGNKKFNAPAHVKEQFPWNVCNGERVVDVFDGKVGGRDFFEQARGLMYNQQLWATFTAARNDKLAKELQGAICAMKINGCDAGHIKQANMKELLEANIVAIQETGLSGQYELVVQAGHHVKCVSPELDPYFSARRKTGIHTLCFAWHCNVNNNDPAKYCLSPSKKAELLPSYAFVTDAPTDGMERYRGTRVPL